MFVWTRSGHVPHSHTCSARPGSTPRGARLNLDAAARMRMRIRMRTKVDVAVDALFTIRVDSGGLLGGNMFIDEEQRQNIYFFELYNEVERKESAYKQGDPTNAVLSRSHVKDPISILTWRRPPRTSGLTYATQA